MQNYSKNAVRGMTWMSVAVLANKLAGLVSQFILGWLLSDNDFGLYAIAISISSLFLALKNGGTEQFLIQKGKDMEEYVPSVLRIAFGFNVASCVILILLSKPLAGLYGMHELTVMLVIVAVSFPIHTPTVIYKARLSVDGKFYDIAKVNTASALTRHLTMVLFALAGAGPMSFVLPLIIIGVLELILYRKAAKRVKKVEHNNVRHYKAILRDTVWIMLGAFAIAIAAQGDYLAVGFILSAGLLGQYFFGYQLIGSIIIIFSNSIQSVLLPSFVNLSEDKTRQAAGYITALKLLATVISPVSVLLSFAIHPVVDVLWKGRWELAADVAQVLILSATGWVMGYIARVYIESCGKWRLRAILLWLDGFGTVICAYVGAYLGGVIGLAISICIYRVTMGYVFITIASHVAGLPITSGMKAVNNPYVASIIFGMVAYYSAGASLFSYIDHQWLVSILLFVLMYAPFAYIIERKNIDRILNLLNH